MSVAFPAPAWPAVGFATGLERHGDRLAIATPREQLTYAQLAERVERTADGLGPARRLVIIAGTNELEPLVAYLAAQRAGYPVMLVPGDNPARIDALVAAYDPDVVVGGASAGWEIVERRSTSAHDLHPDLALLLSTSGSTGSPKMVRLSHENLAANAASIADYLRIDHHDRAATSLPMHYCYGLSVIHSHLLQGAGLILSDLSVVDRCFWDGVRAFGATSFAGVSYTFDLLDRIGFASMNVPSLRYVTQAGGRLAPEQVRRYAELGRRDGWELFVMYGQTEATARMAYLPPDMALAHPTAIGVPIPGGSFDLDPIGDPAVGVDRRDEGEEEGELVYRGPNVMLGYADRPSDLAKGREVEALRTGDIARRLDGGIYEVIGRRSRFAKLFGLRIDLDQVERVLREHGIVATCTGDDARLVVAITSVADEAGIRRIATAEFGLPATSIVVCPFDELPRLANGKPDHVAILVAAGTRCTDAAEGRSGDSVRAVFSDVLQRSDVDDDSTFVTLGGDSLSYVELSVKLERTIGHLPVDWHMTPLSALTAGAPRRRGITQIETGVLLRAVAIVLVVGTHVELFRIRGGAHVLLAIAGYNFARFQLTPAPRPDRGAHMLASITRITAPSVVWIGVMVVATSDYGIANALLLNGHLGSVTWDERWRYWYIEALVQILVVLAAVLALSPVRRLERARPFGFVVGLLVMPLAVRFEVGGIGDLTHEVYRPHTILWVFLLGWAAQRAASTPQKLLVTALVLLAVPGFFGSASREAVIVSGMLLLLWVPVALVPWPLNRAVGGVAAASLYIYLTHPQIYPPVLDRYGSWAALGVSIVAGVVACSVATDLLARAEQRVRRRN